MKRALFIAAMLLVPSAQADETPTLDDVAWLTGCWESPDGKRGYQEQWMGPNGQTMLGMSRTVQDGKTVAWEFLRIHQESDGIYYTSNPSGQTQASFKLVECKDGHVVFENPDHDFPQRIIYKAEKNGSLMATIEGMSQGALKQVEFPMRRAECK